MWRRDSLWRCETKCESYVCGCVCCPPSQLCLDVHLVLAILPPNNTAACLVSVSLPCIHLLPPLLSFPVLLLCLSSHPEPAVWCHCAATVLSVLCCHKGQAFALLLAAHWDRAEHSQGTTGHAVSEQPEPSFCRISKTLCTASLQNLSTRVSPGIRFCWRRT